MKAKQQNKTRSAEIIVTDSSTIIQFFIVFAICILDAEQGLTGTGSRMLLGASHHVSGDVPALPVFPCSAALVCVGVATPNTISVSVDAHLYSDRIGACDVGVVGVNEDA